MKAIWPWQAAEYIVGVESGGEFDHGVLIGGSVILAAAHSIRSKYPAAIETRFGIITVDVLEVDHAADIAVLGDTGNHRDPVARRAFRKFAAATKPVRLARPLQIDDVPARVLDADNRWVSGLAWPASGETVVVEAVTAIQRGASGGPIVNGAGELVGLVSQAIDYHRLVRGPQPSLALPTAFRSAAASVRECRSGR
jgi:S1-C subfamily serine protease